jgi:hypothetical protein
VRDEDLAHAPGTEGLDNPVVVEDLPDHRPPPRVMVPRSVWPFTG